MKIKFVYPYANGLQWSLFKNMKPVQIKGTLYATGHIHAEPENALEKAGDLPVGILCGAKIDLDHLPENMRVARRTNRVKGVPICDECQRVYRTIPTDENRKFAAWVKGV